MRLVQLWLHAILLALCAASAQASDLKLPGFCAPEDDFAPHGVILRMGESYIRVCGRWTESEILRQTLLRVNPSTFRDLRGPEPVRTIRLVRRNPPIDTINRLTGRLDRSAPRLFGGVEYQSFVGGVIGSNGRPSYGVYISDEIPMHWVVCYGENDVHADGSMSCTVFVDRGPYFASIRLSGLFDQHLVFVNHFADYAADIARIMDAADVTERLDQFVGKIDIIE